jgi:ppGpp synthetase/RelA/SpoT-type nucleotidyltranferase
LGAIDDFMKDYVDHFDDYEAAARLCSDKCRMWIEETGIQAIVSFRAKRPDRLEEKLRNQESKRNSAYVAKEEILKEITDLSGVRIALYFPGDGLAVRDFIATAFTKIKKPKDFADRKNKRSHYIIRFPGYAAIHYYVRLKAKPPTREQRLLSKKAIEIQVGSVLMHAWAEAEHDLIYKTKRGEPSQDEYDILHGLNGLVHAGELALERLEKVVAARNAPFRNHYDLHAYLNRALKDLANKLPPDPERGGVDDLFQLLKEANCDNPPGLLPFIRAVMDHPEQKRPVIHQIVDAILAERPDLGESYLKIQQGGQKPYFQGAAVSRDPTYEELIGGYILNWGKMEDLLRRLGKRLEITGTPSLPFIIQSIENSGLLDRRILFKIQPVRHFRNQLVHGRRPTQADVIKASMILEDILGELSYAAQDLI